MTAMWRHHLRQELLELLTMLILGGIPYIYWTLGQTYALPLSGRSVTISTGVPSATATYNFDFTPGSSTDVASIVFQFCSNSPEIDQACVAPSGLSLGGVSLTGESGNNGFSLDPVNSNNNTLVLTRTLGPMSQVDSKYSFSGAINPSATNQTTFVRISTYSSSDGVGSYIDNGSVAFSTSTSLGVGAYVPPYLNLCVGLTVSIDCSQSSGDSVISLGSLVPSTTSTATSQVAAATNDPTGYNLYILGNTMTSGNNVIPNLAAPSTSKNGTSEFGLNFRQNSNPSVGYNPDGNGSAAPANAYNSANLFSFVPGSLIASSTLPTDYNRLTASYIVNVSPGQSPGVYSTSLTYLASAQF